MRFACVLLFAVMVVPANVPAGETELERVLTPAVEQLAKAAGRRQHQRLLLVVREQAGGQAAGQGGALGNLGDQLKQALKRVNLQVVESPEANASLGERGAKPLLPPSRVAALQQQLNFDALVTADLDHGDRKATVRLALIDAERRLFVRVLDIADGVLSNARAGSDGTSSATAGPRMTGPGMTGNADATAFGIAPPLTDGPSAYRKFNGPLQGFRPGRHGGGPRPPKPENCPDPMQDGEDTPPDVGGTGQTGGDTDEDGENSEEVPELNRQIVAFAVSRLGEQVGNGECWTLAAEALRAAGAEPPDLYDFGDEIPLEEIVPGDILQFKSARFDIPNGYILMGLPDHTAIVYGVDGERVFVLHQNFGGRIVTILDINFAMMTEGSVQAYRAVPGRGPVDRNDGEGNADETLDDTQKPASPSRS